MNKIGRVIALAIVGLAAGVVIGEFFPRLFETGIAGALGSVVSEPFTQYRNELATKYGLFGAGIGAAAGVVLMLFTKK